MDKPKPKRKPTAKQLAVLKYLIEGLRMGWLPTVREICLEFDWSSPDAAHQHLRALAARGLVEQRGNQHRIGPTRLALKLYGRRTPTK